MARELVERNEVGESADAVWKALNAEHQKLFPMSFDSGDETLLNELQSGPQARTDSAGLVEEPLALRS